MTKKPSIQCKALTEKERRILLDWENVKHWQNQAKIRESELRDAIVAICVGDDGAPGPEGVSNFEFPCGTQIAVTVKFSRTLDEASLDATMQRFAEDSPARRDGVLVKFKPSLVLAGYRALSSDELLIFADAINEKPSAPTVKVTRPKEEKE